jgi:hypothetical protein
MRISRVAACAVAVGAVVLAVPAAAQASGQAAAVSPVVPSLSMATNPSSFRYGQPVTITITDTVQGTTTPIAGQQIEIYIGRSSNALEAPITDSNGKVSATVTAGLGPARDLNEGVSATAVANATTGSTQNSFRTSIIPDRVLLTATVSATRSSYGSAVTVTGHASFDNGTKTTPLSGDGITVTTLSPTGCWGDTYDGYCPPEPTVTGTTDGSGNFSINQPVRFPEQYGVTAGYSPSEPSGWQQLPARVTFIVDTSNLPVVDSLFGNTNTYGTIHFGSCVFLATYGIPIYPPDQPPYPDVHIQYASSARGPWKTLVTAKPGAKGCAYLSHAAAHGRTVYYRTVTDATPGLLAGYSTPVLPLPVTRTSIHGFRVRPATFRAGARLRVTGWVYEKPSGVSDNGGSGTVEILFRPEGSRRWHVVATISTGSYFQAWLRLRQSGAIQARFLQTYYVYGSHSAVVQVHVR